MLYVKDGKCRCRSTCQASSARPLSERNCHIPRHTAAMQQIMHVPERTVSILTGQRQLSVDGSATQWRTYLTPWTIIPHEEGMCSFLEVQLLAYREVLPFGGAQNLGGVNSCAVSANICVCIDMETRQAFTLQDDGGCRQKWIHSAAAGQHLPPDPHALQPGNTFTRLDHNCLHSGSA